MVTVFFFYGLAFILMGFILTVIRKKEDFLGGLNNLWALVFFAFIHGINEWVDAFILSGRPHNVKMLVTIGAVLLPASFIFIVLFGVYNISQKQSTSKWLRLVPVVCLLPWFLACVTGQGYLTAGIMARYFICFPGFLLVALNMTKRLVLYKKELPKLILVSAIVFISVSTLYAVASGIIVPKADFFPASLINYTNFIKTFGFPVQILRMLCAIVMAVGIFGMIGVYFKEKSKVRLIGGFKRKFLFFTVLFSLVLLVASALVSYLSGVTVLRKITFNNQQAIVQLMANSIGETIESEVKELENYCASPSIWGIAIKDTNLKYSAIPVKEILEYFVNMDQEWKQSSVDNPVVSKYINNMLSQRLKKFAETKGSIAEIFFTDKYGGLVAASGKTSDFYQADEEWWQKAFNEGKGNVFIGEMEFDDSSKTWSIAIAVPVYNKEAGVIGVCKAVYNTLGFSDVVSKFEIGLTGRAMLFDNTGSLICQSGHKLPEIKNSVLPDWNAIKESQFKKPFLSSAYIRRDTGSVFLISWAVVPYKDLLQQGVKWFACVEQDAKEISLGQELVVLLYSIALLVVLVILSWYFSFLFVRILMQPIEKMRLGVQEITQGNLSYHLNLKSGDELEDLADSFNAMINKLSGTLVSRDALIKEIAERKQVESILESSNEKLEKQSEELNVHLEKSKKAHEIMMSMLEDNNIIREVMEKNLAELKQAQEMMVQIAKLSAVGQLASGVAHEVKNPLGIILQGINYLEHKISDKEKDTREVLEMMKGGIERADKIINGLLDFSKSNKLDFKQEDINSVLESSINLAQVSSRFLGVKVIKELTRHLPKVKVDKNKMEQVFINLLVNAAQAMNNEGIITVRSYVKKIEKLEKSRIDKGMDYFAVGEEALIVEIIDTGVGISEENLKKIFDAFFSTKGPKGGGGFRFRNMLEHNGYA